MGYSENTENRDFKIQGLFLTHNPRFSDNEVAAYENDRQNGYIPAHVNSKKLREGLARAELVVKYLQPHCQRI